MHGHRQYLLTLRLGDCGIEMPHPPSDSMTGASPSPVQKAASPQVFSFHIISPVVWYHEVDKASFSWLRTISERYKKQLAGPLVTPPSCWRVRDANHWDPTRYELQLYANLCRHAAALQPSDRRRWAVEGSNVTLFCSELAGGVVSWHVVAFLIEHLHHQKTNNNHHHHPCHPYHQA